MLEPNPKSFQKFFQAISAYNTSYPFAIDCFIWENLKIFPKTRKRLESLANIYAESIRNVVPMYQKPENPGKSEYEWPQVV